MRDIITEIWATARRNKLRTTLTGFAVAWGIFMIIFLLGAGNGLINAVEQNAGRYLTRSMSVMGGFTTKAYKGMSEGRAITLEDRDTRTTRERFGQYVDEMGTEIRHDAVQVVLGDNYVSTSLVGVTPEKARIDKIELLHGRFINDIDNREERKVCVIGDRQARELTDDEASLVGHHVTAGGIPYLVVGISKTDERDMRDEMYTPFRTLRTLYNMGDDVDRIDFSFHGLDTEAANDSFETRYKAALNANHNAAPDDEDAVWIWNRFTESLQMDQGMAIIRTALWVIGLFTLLSGIVGVSNIMLITVKERTREFGIRKAIGAKPASILRLIIVESIIITTLFGFVGMVFGLLANEYMDATIGHMQMDSGVFKATVFVNPTVGIGVCLQALAVMVIAGTLAGLVPARKAARIRPIEALRAE